MTRTGRRPGLSKVHHGSFAGSPERRWSCSPSAQPGCLTACICATGRWCWSPGTASPASTSPGLSHPPAARLIDLPGATLLPGLINGHTHLVFDASTDPAGHLQAVSDQVLLEEARSAARQELQAGVTSVRDLGDRSYLGARLRAETAARPELGPDVVPAGPPITVPAGHCWFLGGAASGANGVRQAVRAHAGRGAAVIKVMVTGGRMTAGTAVDACQFSAGELRAAADEAHEQGLPITGHAHGRDGIVAALHAGFDGIEHASFLTAQGLEPDPRVIDDLAAAGTVVSGAIPATVPGVPLRR